METAQGNPTRILLIEDDPEDARRLQETLAASGKGPFLVTYVDRFEAAERRLVDGGFDVVLLDLSLPDVSALDSVRRARTVAPETPSVVLASERDYEVALSAVRQGAQDYVIKGEYDSRLLLRVLRHAVERQQWTANLERMNQRLENELAERQRAEETLRERARCLRSQSNVLVSLTQSDSLRRNDLPVAIREITAAAAKALEVPRVSVWLLDGSSRVRRVETYNSNLLYDASWAHESGEPDLDAAQIGSLLTALECERTVAVADAEEDGRTRAFWNAYLMPMGTPSVLVAAIRVGGRVVGFLCQEYAGRRRRWHPEEEQFCASLADLVGGAIETGGRRRAEAALHGAEERLQTVINNVPVALFALDANGIFTFAQGKVLAALQIEAAELLGSSVFDVFSEVPEMLISARRALGGVDTSARMSLSRERAGGVPSFDCHLDVSLVPIFERDGGVSSVIGVATDVSELARTERERRILEAHAREAQKLGSLDRLASGIAHEFDELLTEIVLNAGAARQSLPPGSVARSELERIRVAAVRAIGLTHQLLTCTGERSVQPQVLSLSALVEEMTNALEMSVPPMALLEIGIEENLPPINGDALQLRQIVLNLLANASESLVDGHGRVEIRTGTVDADRTYLAETYPHQHLPEGEYAFLEVSDDGSGMDAAAPARIFDPFYSTKAPGRGLGLATVLGIVRAHRGALKVETRPGQGTTIRVLFPIAGPRMDANDALAELGRAVAQAPREADRLPLVARQHGRDEAEEGALLH